MITRQRLGQLIKEETFIYTTRFGGKKPEKFKLYKDFYMSQKDTLCCLNKSQEFLVCEVKFKYLFETEEDAEFALKYKRIPRTEYLDLPTWEEIEDDYNLKFDNSKVKVDKIENRIIVLTNGDYLDLYDYIFEKPATKENYLEACELCKKLFLGEKA